MSNKQSFRTGAQDPAAHNEMVALLKHARHLNKLFKAAVRAFVKVAA